MKINFIELKAQVQSLAAHRAAVISESLTGRHANIHPHRLSKFNEAIKFLGLIDRVEGAAFAIITRSPEAVDLDEVKSRLAADIQKRAELLLRLSGDIPASLDDLTFHQRQLRNDIKNFEDFNKFLDLVSSNKVPAPDAAERGVMISDETFVR